LKPIRNNAISDQTYHAIEDLIGSYGAEKRVFENVFYCNSFELMVFIIKSIIRKVVIGHHFFANALIFLTKTLSAIR
jgi:hypothetical protein